MKREKEERPLLLPNSETGKGGEERPLFSPKSVKSVYGQHATVLTNSETGITGNREAGEHLLRVYREAYTTQGGIYLRVYYPPGCLPKGVIGVIYPPGCLPKGVRGVYIPPGCLPKGCMGERYTHQGASLRKYERGIPTRVPP